MDQAWIFWLVLSVLFLAVELGTVALVSIWFVLGSVVALFASLAGMSLTWQIILMLVVSGIGLIIFLMIKDKLNIGKNPHVPTNADALIGEEAVVIEKINALDNKGLVRVKGREWRAVASPESEEIEVGEIVKILSIQGVKLIVSK